MKKGVIITFIISTIIFLAIGTVLMLITVPQAKPISDSGNKYESIPKNDYTYVPTKDITTESIIEQYNVNEAYINDLIKNRYYKPGNADPFTNGVSSSSNTNPDPSDNTGNGTGTSSSSNPSNSGTPSGAPAK